MKWTYLLLFVFAPAYSATLKEAFEAAKLNMESIKRADSQVKQAIERKNQALATLLPTISAVGNDTRIDAPKQEGVNKAFILTRQYSAGLRLQQPLIRGGAVSAYSIRKEDILLSEFQKEGTLLNLFQLIVAAYYDVKSAELDLKILNELLKFSHDRVKELRQRTSVGRSRKGELVQAETQLLTAEAQQRQGKMNLLESLEVYEFYTKQRPQNLPELSLIPKELPRLTDYLDKLKTRPDLMARAQEVRTAQLRVEASKGGHWPSVDLVSNYYFDRTGVLQTSEWDLSLMVNVPLYQGGGVAALVRESVEAKRVAELNSHETVRAAKRDLVILYENYGQIQAQLDTYQSALKKAEEAYRLNLQDYRFGLATNLEVLQSLNLFIDTKRFYNNLLAMSHRTYRNLEASIGVLP